MSNKNYLKTIKKFNPKGMITWEYIDCLNQTQIKVSNRES